MNANPRADASGPALPRRAFLQGLAGGIVLAGGAPGGPLARAQDARPGLITVTKEPLNQEFPFSALSSFRTPTELFYVRNHYPQPRLDANTFQVEVVGAVKTPLTLSLADLRKLGEKSLPVTLECAGNGRSTLVPPAKGVPWGLGAVGTATWEGVPLGAVLERAGVAKDAVEVLLEGADAGDPKKDGQPPGAVVFARSLSLEKARRPEVLLSWGMNGQPLSLDHGFPLRAVVAGWYGMASVKWLRRIIVTRKPFAGFDQTFDYGYWQLQDGLPTLVPLTTMQVKSSIARPVVGEAVPAGQPYRVHGAAWAGERDVRRVEVSTDGGKTWADARVLGNAVPYCWRLWEFTWTPPAAGAFTVLSRATDSAGAVQPARHDPMRRNYMINFVRPTPVTVRG